MSTAGRRLRRLGVHLSSSAAELDASVAVVDEVATAPRDDEQWVRPQHELHEVTPLPPPDPELMRLLSLGELDVSKLSPEAVRSMMRLVVSHPDGTGNFAEAKGYMVGGKTGTSEKINPDGGYFKDKNIASFAATFPVHDPRYVLVVMVDEPKGKKHSYGYATGGWVAAPAAKRIIEHSAPLLGILPVDENSPEIRQKLRLDFKIGKEEKALASY